MNNALAANSFRTASGSGGGSPDARLSERRRVLASLSDAEVEIYVGLFGDTGEISAARRQRSLEALTAEAVNQDGPPRACA